MNKVDKVILIDLDYTLYDVENQILHSDAKNFISYAKKCGEIFLFTEGDRNFQMKKVKKYKLDKLFKGNLKLYDEYKKMDEIKKEIKGKKIILVDDRPDVIDKAKLLGWKTIRVKRGRYKKKEGSQKPTYITNDLETIIKLDYLNK